MDIPHVSPFLYIGTYMVNLIFFLMASILATILLVPSRKIKINSIILAVMIKKRKMVLTMLVNDRSIEGMLLRGKRCYLP